MSVECPHAWQRPCLKLNRRKHVLCINESQVCDNNIDCPKGDDEDPLLCATYKEVNYLICTLFLQRNMIDAKSNAKNRLFCTERLYRMVTMNNELAIIN